MLRYFFCFLFSIQIPIQLLSQNVFLLAGQSNATGQGDKSISNSLFITNKSLEYDVLLDSLKPLNDPAGQNWKDLEPANTGSILPAFTYSLTQKTGKTVIVISAARGGSSCHKGAELSNYGTWDSTGNLFSNTKEKVNSALKHTKSKLSGIIWMQGERDANAINDGVITAEDYKSSLVSLIHRFRKEFGHEIPFFIILTGYQKDRPQFGNDHVRDIQSWVSEHMDNVYIAFDKTHHFTRLNLMKDHVHFNQMGLNEIGIKVGEFVAKVLKK